MLSQFGRLIHLKPRILSTGLILSLSFFTSDFYSVSAQHPESPANSNTSASTTTPPKTTSKRSLADGVYLYGQSAKPEQIQQEYFVFELQDNKVTGAFYMPHSSFDCFRGYLKEGKLDLTITDSYEETAYSHSVRLQDYQPVALMSQKDQSLLRTCRNSRFAQDKRSI